MNKSTNNFEITTPVGSRKSLTATTGAGASSVYFGIGKLNMRSHSANHFTIDNLKEIAETCNAKRIQTYLTVNIVIYSEDTEIMYEIIDAAEAINTTTVIASDVAVMMYCRRVRIEVRLSIQLDISNIDALKFYTQLADVAVLARGLNMDQVREVHEQTIRQNIYGPKRQPIHIEMSCHDAFCMVVFSKRYMSFRDSNRSANCGICTRVYRRSYTVTNNETGNQLEIDSKYIMSPKDLRSARFIGRMMDAGVRMFKIEGRARGSEYVHTAVSCYKEVIESVFDGTFAEEEEDQRGERLPTVFNRGFQDGYYRDQKVDEWTKNYGNKAIRKKVLIGEVIKYLPRLSVAEAAVEANTFVEGEKFLITGNNTGAMFLNAEKTCYDLNPVDKAERDWHVSTPAPDKIRPNDELFKLVTK